MLVPSLHCLLGHRGVHRAQDWMLAMGQSSADADEVACGLRDALGRSVPATVRFAEFVCCYHWCDSPAGQSA